MAYSAPPARTEISDTYPNPSNAVARVGFGKLWDYVTGLLGSTGSPTAAKAALLVPVDVDFTNRILNGSMQIDQRNAGASVTPANGSYSVDRWQFYVSQASKLTAQQSSTAPAGFTKSLLVTSSSAYSIGASDFFSVQQSIEGYNVADLGWGSAGASSVTLSFWVRSSLIGTFGGSIVNGAANRSYPFTYTISSANTWEQKTVTIAGDITGTWAIDNSRGLVVYFSLGTGAAYTGAAGSWAAANYQNASGATSVVGTNGATFYITGVQLEKGTAATGFACRPYGAELALCQRYYSMVSTGISGIAVDTTRIVVGVQFPIVMRAQPSVGLTSPTRVSDVYTSSFIQSSASVSARDTSSLAVSGATYTLNNFTGLTTGRAFFIETSGAYGAVTLSSEL